jgi:hypothetical protein
MLEDPKEEARRSAEELDADVRYITELGAREERLWKMREAAMLAERKRREDERCVPRVPVDCLL